MATHAVHIVAGMLFFADMAMLLVHCQGYVQVLCGREGVVSNNRDRWTKEGQGGGGVDCLLCACVKNFGMNSYKYMYSTCKLKFRPWTQKLHTFENYLSHTCTWACGLIVIECYKA